MARSVGPTSPGTTGSPDGRSNEGDSGMRSFGIDWRLRSQEGACVKGHHPGPSPLSNAPCMQNARQSEMPQLQLVGAHLFAKSKISSVYIYGCVLTHILPGYLEVGAMRMRTKMTTNHLHSKPIKDTTRSRSFGEYGIIKF